MSKRTGKIWEKSKKDRISEDPKAISMTEIKNKMSRQKKRTKAHHKTMKAGMSRKRRRVTEDDDTVPQAEATTKKATAAASKWNDELEECRYNADLLLKNLSIGEKVFCSASDSVLRTADVMYLLSDLLNPSIGQYKDAITAEIKLTAEPRLDVSTDGRMEEDAEETVFDKLDVFSKRKLLALYIAYTELMAPQLDMLRGTFRSVSTSIRSTRSELKNLQSKVSRVERNSERTISSIVKEVDTHRIPVAQSNSSGGAGKNVKAGAAAAVGFSQGRLFTS